MCFIIEIDTHSVTDSPLTFTQSLSLAHFHLLTFTLSFSLVHRKSLNIIV